MIESPNDVVYINCKIEGEPARILRELCRRGLVKSYTDAINQGLLALYEGGGSRPSNRPAQAAGRRGAS